MESSTKNSHQFSSHQQNKIVLQVYPPLQQRDPSRYNFKSKDQMKRKQRIKNRNNFNHISNQQKNSRRMNQHSSRGQNNGFSNGKSKIEGKNQISGTCIPLFIGGLTASMGQEEISTLLKEIGPIHDLQLATDPQNGALKGYAFFKVRSGRVACSFLSKKIKVGSKSLFCQLKSPKTKKEIEKVERLRIFIRGELISIQEENLMDYFEQYGKVKLVQILKDFKTGLSQNIAFIEFYSKDCVQRATQIKYQKIQGVEIQVQNYNTDKNSSLRSYPSHNYTFSKDHQYDFKKHTSYPRGLQSFQNYDQDLQRNQPNSDINPNIIQKYGRKDKKCQQNETQIRLKSDHKKSRPLNKPNQHQNDINEHYQGQQYSRDNIPSLKKDFYFQNRNNISSSFKESINQDQIDANNNTPNKRQFNRQQNPLNLPLSQQNIEQNQNSKTNRPGSHNYELGYSKIQNNEEGYLIDSQDLDRDSAQLYLLEELLRYFRHGYTPENSDTCCSVALRKALRRSSLLECDQTNYLINLSRHKSRFSA